MNQKFTIQGAEFNNINTGVSAKLGEITIEVTDLNLVEYIQLVKAVPSVAREIGQAITEAIEQYQTSSLEHARAVAEFEQEQMLRHRENMPSFRIGFGVPFSCQGCDADGDMFPPFGEYNDSDVPVASDDDDDIEFDEEPIVNSIEDDNINDDELQAQAQRFADRVVKKARRTTERSVPVTE